MALPTPTTIAKALEEVSDHELVAAVRENFLERMETTVHESPSDANGRIMLAHKAVVAFFESIPEVTLLEQLKPWYADTNSEKRNRTLPSIWLKKANKPALAAIRNVLRSILRGLSPIVMVSAVAEVFGYEAGSADLSRRQLNYIGRDERTKTFAENLTPIFRLAFTPDNYPKLVHELNSIPWCTNAMEVRRWVNETLQLAGQRASYDAEELISQFDEEFYWDRYRRHEHRLLSKPKQVRAQYIVEFLVNALMETFEDFALVRIEDVGQCLWGKQKPKTVQALLEDESVKFLVTFFRMLPDTIAKRVIGCGQFLYFGAHYRAAVDPAVVAIGKIVAKPEAVTVLFDLLKEVDPKLVKGWNGMQIRDEMPLVE